MSGLCLNGAESEGLSEQPKTRESQEFADNFLASWSDSSKVYSIVSQRISVAHLESLLFNNLLLAFLHSLSQFPTPLPCFLELLPK